MTNIFPFILYQIPCKLNQIRVNTCSLQGTKFVLFGSDVKNSSCTVLYGVEGVKISNTFVIKYMKYTGGLSVTTALSTRGSCSIHTWVKQPSWKNRLWWRFSIELFYAIASHTCKYLLACCQEANRGFANPCIITVTLQPEVRQINTGMCGGSIDVDQRASRLDVLRQ